MEFKKCNILIYGDFMVDKYISGEVARISPEAPVPVLKVISTDLKLGGAGNVANNIASLGGTPYVMSVSGNDEDGHWLKKQLERIGCNTAYFELSDQINTICKTRVVSRGQQFIRIDKEQPIVHSPINLTKLQNNLTQIIRQMDAIIISDYGKGMADYASASAIINMARQYDIPIVVDPKGNDYSKYMGATICTPNMKELMDAVGHTVQSEEEILTEGHNLVKSLNLKYLLLTRSEKGLSLFEKNRMEKRDFPAVPKEVIDVTGAGDTVVSVIAMGLGSKIDIEMICKLANKAASIAISRFGTTAITHNELFSDTQEKPERKILSQCEALPVIKKLKEKGKKIVFTNGCFDLIHAGHLESLQAAKKLGDILIVGLNSDNSIQALKGSERPVIKENDRASMLAGLSCVNYVIVFDELTPECLIRELHPNILVKGVDWKNKPVAGSEFVDRVEFINLKEGLSTTKIIERIKAL